ncbi:MAG TPA: hypothetical protein VG076_14055 [Acidimicrobiales bacterium]|jgi:hypothetical protein|nr:hypothetical protein [Acidimicrobiales bacterium]
MSGPEPMWTAECHLDAVYRRGRQLRRRRHLAIASAPLLALGLVGVAVAGLPATSKPSVVNVAQGRPHESSDGAPASGPAEDGGPGALPAHSGTQERGGTATPDSADAVASGQATGSQALVPAPAGGPSNPTSGSSSPSAAQGPSPSGGPPNAKTGQAPNTAAPTASSACGPSDLQYTTHTDRSRYASGQAVAVTLVVTNRSSHPCNGPSPCGVGPWATVQNSAGTVVWQSHPLATMCSNPPPVPHLAAGQSATYGAGTWNQTICASSGTCSAAPSGSYTATARRGDLTAAAARFRIS